MALQTFGIRVKSAASFKRDLLRRVSAHFEKRVRQRRAAIVGGLRQLREPTFDCSRYTGLRNDASQLVRIFFRLMSEFQAACARKRFAPVKFADVFVPNMDGRKGLLAM